MNTIWEMRLCSLERAAISGLIVLCSLGYANAAQDEPLSDSPPGPEAPTDEVDAPEGFWGGRLLRGIDDRLQIRLGGYALVDAGGVSQGAPLDVLEGAPDEQALRALEIKLRGVLYREFEIAFTLTLNDGDLELQDNYIERQDIPYLGRIRLGHFKEPFGLENQTSIRYIPFLERSLADALTPSRGLGIAIFSTTPSKRMTLSGGFFYQTDNIDNISETAATAITGRFTSLPHYNAEKRSLFHFGASFTHRKLRAEAQFRVRPEVNSAPRYLETGDFAADSLTQLDLEFAYQRGPLLAQGEVLFGVADDAGISEKLSLNDIAGEVADRFPRLVDFLSGRFGFERPANSVLWRIPLDIGRRRDSTYHSIYAQASYSLTGEQRAYDAELGRFGTIVPERPFRLRGRDGWGAAELAARISHIDIDDGTLNGGRELNFSLGANWYLNETVRLMANYVHGEVWRDEQRGSFDAFQVRLQVDFTPRRLSDWDPIPGILKREP